MQELVAITKHLEKLLRACERAAAANDLQVIFSCMYIYISLSSYMSLFAYTRCLGHEFCHAKLLIGDSGVPFWGC